MSWRPASWLGQTRLGWMQLIIEQCAFGGKVTPRVVQGEDIAPCSPDIPIEFITEGQVMKLTAHTFSDVTPLCAQYYYRYQTVESPNPPWSLRMYCQVRQLLIHIQLKDWLFINMQKMKLIFFIKLRTSYIKVYSEVYQLALIDKT